MNAISGTDAWAVGTFYLNLSTGRYGALIEHWNGSAWTRLPGVSRTAGGFLTGVAATSAMNAWAVGGTGAGDPVIEH